MGICTFHDRVSLRFCGEIADVRLIRPERKNALDGPMFEGLADVPEVLGSPSARAVVLSDEGGNLCAGLDR